MIDVQVKPVTLNSLLYRLLIISLYATPPDKAMICNPELAAALDAIIAIPLARLY